MALQFSVAVRGARMQSIESTAGTSPKLRILTGSQPASCSAAQTGSLLAELTLPSDWWAISGATGSLLGGATTGTAGATGTAGYFRLVNNSGVACLIQGSVGTSGTDMIVDSVSFTNGQAFSILSFSITSGNA